jgi:hypothetical protein
MKKILVIAIFISGIFASVTGVQASSCAGLQHEDLWQCQCNNDHNSPRCDGRLPCDPGMMPNSLGIVCVKPKNTQECLHVLANSTYENGQCLTASNLVSPTSAQTQVDRNASAVLACTKLYGPTSPGHVWVLIKGRCASKSIDNSASTSMNLKPNTETKAKAKACQDLYGAPRSGSQWEFVNGQCAEFMH